MTEENRKLLLVDLCGRLPYGVVVNYNGLLQPLFGIEPTQHFQIILDNALDGEHNGLVYVSLDVGENPKPYLRPLSSMTKEELHEVQEILGKGVEIREDFILSIDSSMNSFTYLELQAVFDWLNAHYFDYRGLIEKGLAIEVTEENNPYKI